MNKAKRKPISAVAQSLRDMADASVRRQKGENVLGKDVRKERKAKEAADRPGAMGRMASENTGNYSSPPKPPQPASPPSPPKPGEKKKRSIQDEIKARRFYR